MDFVAKNKPNYDLVWEAMKWQESKNDHYGTLLDVGGPLRRLLKKPVISKAGAVGIAQILPSTAKDVAQKHGIPWSLERLHNDPAYNERLGKLYFLDFTKNPKYNDDLDLILAAYNWGPGNLAVARDMYGDNWRQRWKDKNNKETPHYIKVIKADYANRLAKLNRNGGPDQKDIIAPEIVTAQAYGPPSPTTEQRLDSAIADVIKNQKARASEGQPDQQNEAEKLTTDPNQTIAQMQNPQPNAATPLVASSDPAPSEEVRSVPNPVAQAPAPLPDQQTTVAQADKPDPAIAQIKAELQAYIPPTQEQAVDINSFIENPNTASYPQNPFNNISETAYPGFEDKTPTAYYDSQGALEGGVRPNGGYFSRLGRQFVQAYEDETTISQAERFAIERFKADSERRGIKKLTKEMANELYPGLPQPFTESVDPAVAKYIYDEHRKKVSDAMYNERGPQLDWASQFVVGGAAFMLDPTNLLLGGVTSAGLKAAGVAAKSFRGLLSAGAIEAEATALKTAGVAAESFKTVVATNALISAEVTALRAKSRALMQDPMSNGEVAQTIAMDTMFGTALHYGIRVVTDGLKGAVETIKKTDPDIISKNMKKIAGTVDGGKPVSTAADAIVRAQKEAGMTPVGSGAKEYVFSPDLKDKKLFVPINQDGSKYTIGDSIDLVTAVDNPNAARNVGKAVSEITLPKEARFVPFGAKLGDPEISGIIGKIETGVPFQDGMRLGEYIRTIKQAEMAGTIEKGTLEKVNQAFKDAGYIGYSEVLAYEGKPVGNRAMLFDPESVKASTPIPVDEAKVYRPSEVAPEETKTSSGAEVIEKNADPLEPKQEAIGRISEPTDGVPEQTKLEGERALNELKSIAEKDPTIREELDQIIQQEKRDMSAAKIARALLECGARQFL